MRLFHPAHSAWLLVGFELEPVSTLPYTYRAEFRETHSLLIRTLGDVPEAAVATVASVKAIHTQSSRTVAPCSPTTPIDHDPAQTLPVDLGVLRV